MMIARVKRPCAVRGLVKRQGPPEGESRGRRSNNRQTTTYMNDKLKDDLQDGLPTLPQHQQTGVHRAAASPDRVSAPIWRGPGASRAAVGWTA
jgi:hypothetical protein